MERKRKKIWSNIWVKPRETMQLILDTDPNKNLVSLAIVHGILVGIYLVLSFLDSTEVPKVVQSFGFSLLLIVGSIIFSLFVLFFISYLYQITGKWLKGKGSYVEVKSATGWSFYPLIVSVPFFIAAAIIYITTTLPALAMTLMIIGQILSIWGLVIFFMLLAQAHKFGAWKAILCYLLALLLIIVAVAIIFLLIKAVSPLFTS